MLNNRVQNILITMDKVKLCLRVPGQTCSPPLRLLTDAEVVAHLWSGEKSIAKRLIRKAAELLGDDRTARQAIAANTRQATDLI